MRLNRLLRAIAMIMAFVLYSSALLAQKRNITGIISDQNGAPLAGATITVKGEKTVATSDNNGAFTISVSPNAVLVVSYVGAKNLEIPTADKTTVVGTVDVIDKKLSEVVVIGYGSRKRSEVTSSISSVSTKELKDLPVAGIDQALQGKVAGVTVTSNSGQPGGGVSLKVRGVTTINSNDPLIVIDGVPFVSNTKNSPGYAGLGGSDGQTGNSVMATLNPNDFETIDILKDASAQAIYGSQAANGVILITTKKGRTGEGKIAYDMYYGQSEVYRKLDLMNLQQFAVYQNAVAPLLGLQPTPELADPSKLGEGTDWQDAIFQRGQIQSHQLSFSGGKDKTNYYLSGNYFTQDGILIGSDFKRYTMRFNLDHQLKNWIKIGVSVNASRSIQNVTLADAAEGTIWWAGVQSPLIPVKNLDGTWGGGGQNVGGFQYGQDNPVARSYYRGNESVSNQVFGNVYADINFLKYFNWRNEFSWSLNNGTNTAFQKSGDIGNTTLRSQLFDRRNSGYYYAFRSYVNYNRGFNRHSISATAGHEAQYSYWEAISGKKVDLANNILDLNAGSNDRDTWELGGGKGEWSMESWFGRANYSYDNRYALSFSIRADKSYYFGPNNKVGWFPGASFAWTVTNEKFAEGIKSTVNNLKVRLGYGSVGNQNLPSGSPNPPYTTVVSFWPGPVGFGNSSYISLENPDLSWESVTTSNAGIDATLFNGVVDLSVDVYKKTTSDMLLFLTGPRLIGVGDQWDDLKAPVGNAGQMSNSGVDISLTTRNITKKDFTWTTNVIFSSFKNKLDKMANSTAGLTGKVYYDNYTLTFTKPGYAVGSFFGLVTDGLFRTQADLNASLPQFGYSVDQTHTWLGDIRFADVNGDKKINEDDITFIGSPLPKFTYGFTNKFNYKEFDLNIFLQGSQGAKIFNFMRWQLEKMDNAFYNQLNSVSDRYTDANTGGSLPRFTNTNVNNVYMSDRYIENGSYLRIQNITLGYRLPQRWLSKAKISNVRFYVAAQNIYTFTDYSGYDPEIGAFNNNIRLMNVDMGHYPNPRTYTIGASIEL